MENITNLFGFTVIQNPFMAERIYTKKQTRKFKNNRWCKKYLKKYSKEIPRKDALVNEINKTIVCHPITYQAIQSYVQTQKSKPRPTIEWVDKYSCVKEEFKVQWRPRFGFDAFIKPDNFFLLGACS